MLLFTVPPRSSKSIPRLHPQLDNSIADTVTETSSSYAGQPPFSAKGFFLESLLVVGFSDPTTATTAAVHKTAVGWQFAFVG